MGQQLGPLAHEMVAPAHQVSGCPHLPGVNIGHGDQSALEQGCDLVGVDFIILVFAAVDGPHVQSMAQNKGNSLVGAALLGGGRALSFGGNRNASSANQFSKNLSVIQTGYA